MRSGVLRESRKKDSRTKRTRVLAVLDQMKASGEPVTFLAVARTAKVSNWLVYSSGVREHIEDAMKSQSRAARHQQRSGTGASAESLATDLALAVEENKALRAERDRLKQAVQRSLGDQLDQTGARELTGRVNELLQAVERLTVERDEIRAQRDQLKRQLDEMAEDLAAARAAGRRLLKQVNRDSQER
jgi:regulator of replication initiation timing